MKLGVRFHTVGEARGEVSNEGWLDLRARRDQNRSEAVPGGLAVNRMASREAEPAKCRLPTLSPQTGPSALARQAEHPRTTERDYEERKQVLGLGQDAGRGWRGFHHHATLGIGAHRFLAIEGSRFSPNARSGRLELRAAKIPPRFQPRGAGPQYPLSDSAGLAILPVD